MANRLKLQDKLKEILGNENVYFKAPSTMHYPCIRLSLADKDDRKADNIRYITHDRYTITFITSDITSDVPNQILEQIPMSSFDTQYIKDNLVHTVLTIFD